MPVEEYNRVHDTLKSIKEYKLNLNIIIMHYFFNTEGIIIIPVKHGNAKKKDAQVFRSTQHSVKIECERQLKKARKHHAF